MHIEAVIQNEYSNIIQIPTNLTGGIANLFSKLGGGSSGSSGGLTGALSTVTGLLGGAAGKFMMLLP